MDYMKMRAYLYTREKKNTVTFKQKELEAVWFCTGKNVKRKLKKYQEAGLLVYHPGVGRGHPSTLLFRKAFKTEVTAFAHDLIKKDQMEQVMKLLQLSIPKPWVAALSDDIQSLFGFQTDKKRGDVLRSIIARPLTPIDPLTASVTFESFMVHELSDTLVVYDKAEDKVKPHLAHHWKVGPDSCEWTFYLRKGVKFHHQREMTSRDVIHTLCRFQETENPYDWVAEDIVEMTGLSDYAVRLRLSKPNPFFLRYLAVYNFGILPYDVPFDEKSWIASGPFKMKENTKEKFTLEAFDDYFLERPLLDEIEFWKEPAVQALPAANFEVEGQKEAGSRQAKEQIETGFRFITFNFHRKTAVQDPYFRKALYHIFDKEKMIRDLKRTEYVPASSYFHWLSGQETKDSAAVAGLLERSGYTGEPLVFYCLSSEKAIEEAEWMVKEAESFGVALDLQPVTMKTMFTDQVEKQADLVTLGEVASNDIHVSFLGAFYNKHLLFRRMLGENHLAHIDEALECFKREPDPEKRMALIERIEGYLKENNLVIYLYHPLKRRTFHSMIRSIHFDSYGYVNLRKLWIPADQR